MTRVHAGAADDDDISSSAARTEGRFSPDFIGKPFAVEASSAELRSMGF